MTIAFFDFETTGLDPDIHDPVEVACVVTDDSFNELAAFESLIKSDSLGLCDWDAPAREMHDQSGLTQLAEREGRPLHLVAVDLYDFLATHAGKGPLHLAGNSVHFDRGFLRVHFPDVERLFHHRHLDVSSVRMLGERVCPTAMGLCSDKPHRAMADVRRSIAELHHWTRILRGQP